jgi:hypothetical protein
MMRITASLPCQKSRDKKGVSGESTMLVNLEVKPLYSGSIKALLRLY